MRSLLLRRPQAIPFIISSAGWLRHAPQGYSYPFALWRPTPGNANTPTYQHLVYELFQAVRGEYVEAFRNPITLCTLRL